MVTADPKLLTTLRAIALSAAPEMNEPESG